MAENICALCEGATMISDGEATETCPRCMGTAYDQPDPADRSVTVYRLGLQRGSILLVECGTNLEREEAICLLEEGATKLRSGQLSIIRERKAQ